MSYNMEDAFNSYFGVDVSDKRRVQAPVKLPIKPNKQKLSAEGNVSDIDQLGELLRVILNAAWGTGWGEIRPEMSKSSTLNNLTVPVITYDINSREVADKMPIKPTLNDSVQELDVNGRPTGDTFLVYRQWFDCIVEFNVWGRNSLEARKVMSDFESIMNSYSGYLKKLGISEMFFLKEIPSSKSVNYIPGVPMRSMMYYVRLERIQSVRQSVLQKIDIEVDAYNSGNNKSESSVDIYKNNHINYDL